MSYGVPAHDDVAMNIMNERRGEIDRNPSIKCDCCETAHRYQGYWEPRWLLRDDPASGKTICDECQAELADLHDRLTNNRRLTEFVEDPREGEA